MPLGMGLCRYDFEEGVINGEVGRLEVWSFVLRESWSLSVRWSLGKG